MKTKLFAKKYSALVIDCGGTTDISSCMFKVDNRRVSYAIDIETGYENGSTDFGGNNLTYRSYKNKSRHPHLPYTLTGFTYTGEEIYLIDDSQKKYRGVISRNIDDLALTVYLKDSEKHL